MKNLVNIILTLALLMLGLFAFEQESEHPPLQENTKKAIAKYQANPNEANKNELLKILEQNYDNVIARKKEKLAQRVKERDKNINMWLQSVRKGGEPAFMKLETSNNKGNEREAIRKAIEDYKNNPNATNEKALKIALNNYYDAFLKEQEEHIKETINLKSQRIEDTLERFSSKNFAKNMKNKANIKVAISQDEILAEVINSYISMGAEIVPVNPESRVRERNNNAAIYTAQEKYTKEPTMQNKQALRNEILKALKTAYESRVQGIAKAMKKGKSGGEALYKKLQDDEFLQMQYIELTQQRNLYGRIDRIITFGSNTASNWTPRMKQESIKLAKILKSTKQDSTNSTKLKSEFDKLYSQCLKEQAKHIKEVESRLEKFADEILKELI